MVDFKPLIDELKVNILPMLEKDEELAAKLVTTAVFNFVESLIPPTFKPFAVPSLEMLKGFALKVEDKIDGVVGN